MAFWFHENVIYEGARIHRAACPQCNNGKGSDGSESHVYRWVGPFRTYHSASRAATQEAAGLRASPWPLARRPAQRWTAAWVITWTLICNPWTALAWLSLRSQWWPSPTTHQATTAAITTKATRRAKKAATNGAKQ